MLYVLALFVAPIVLPIVEILYAGWILRNQEKLKLAGACGSHVFFFMLLWFGWILSVKFMDSLYNGEISMLLFCILASTLIVLLIVGMLYARWFLRNQEALKRGGSYRLHAFFFGLAWVSLLLSAMLWISLLW